MGLIFGGIGLYLRRSINLQSSNVVQAEPVHNKIHTSKLDTTTTTTIETSDSGWEERGEGREYKAISLLLPLSIRGVGDDRRVEGGSRGLAEVDRTSVEEGGGGIGGEGKGAREGGSGDGRMVVSTPHSDSMMVREPSMDYMHC